MYFFKKVGHEKVPDKLLNKNAEAYKYLKNINGK